MGIGFQHTKKDSLPKRGILKTIMVLMWLKQILTHSLHKLFFLTGINYNNRFVGIDFGATQNLKAMQDSNRILFCGGMFSCAVANDFVSSVGSKIRSAIEEYKNHEDEDMAGGTVFSGR